MKSSNKSFVSLQDIFDEHVTEFNDWDSPHPSPPPGLFLDNLLRNNPEMKARNTQQILTHLLWYKACIEVCHSLPAKLISDYDDMQRVSRAVL